MGIRRPTPIRKPEQILTYDEHHCTTTTSGSVQVEHHGLPLAGRYDNNEPRSSDATHYEFYQTPRHRAFGSKSRKGSSSSVRKCKQEYHTSREDDDRVSFHSSDSSEYNSSDTSSQRSAPARQEYHTSREDDDRVSLHSSDSSEYNSSDTSSRKSPSAVSEISDLPPSYIPPWTLDQQLVQGDLLASDYELPCEFVFIGCTARFHPDDHAEWIAHSIEHFTRDVSPPQRAICIFCDTEFTCSGTPTRREGWSQRMDHIHNDHLRKGESFDSAHPDLFVVKHMRTHGLIPQELYDNLMGLRSRLDGLRPPGWVPPERKRQIERSFIVTHNLEKEKRALKRKAARSKHDHLMAKSERPSHSSPIPPQSRLEERTARGDFKLERCHLTRPCKEEQKEIHPPYHFTPGSFSENRLQVAKVVGDESHDPSCSEPKLEDIQVRNTQLIADDNTQSDDAHSESASKAGKAMPTNIVGEVALSLRTNSQSSNSVRTLSEISSHPWQMNRGREVSNSSLSPISGFSSLDDPSSSFETDSACSEDEMKEEVELSIWPTTTDILTLVSAKMRTEVSKMQTALLDHVMTSMKQALVDSIMDDFWLIFNQEWSANIRRCSGSPSTSSSGSVMRGANEQTEGSSTNRQKRQREDDYDDDGSTREGRDEDPARINSCQPEIQNDKKKFACPFRKCNSRKYNQSTYRWRTCALASFDTIARLKAHLYRNHRCFQCGRCGELFKDENSMTQHFMAVRTCDLKPFIGVEGLTMAVERQLRSRKKAYPSQTPEDRWRAIYRILFPIAPVPSPYFESVQDGTTESTDLWELSDYGEYSRRELPRVFRTAIEATFNEQSQPLEDHLRNRLVDMIKECQSHVFSTYRLQLTSNQSMSHTTNSDFAPAFTSPSPVGLGSDNRSFVERQEGQEGLVDTLQNFYQEPPYQTNTQSAFDFSIPGQDFMGLAGQNLLPDSGHASVVSTLFNSGPSGSVISTAGSSLVSSSHVQQPAQFFGGFNRKRSQLFPSTVMHASSMMDPTATPDQIEDFTYLFDNPSSLNPYGRETGI